MSALVAALAAAAAVAVASTLWDRGEGANRVLPLPGRAGRPPVGRGSASGPVAPGHTGSSLRFARRAPPGSAPPRATPSRGLVVSVVGLVVAVALVVGPVVAVAGTVLIGGARIRGARAVKRKRARAVDSSVPDLVDLFVIAAAAGHTVHACLHLVADRAPAPVRPALIDARSAVARGMPLAEALRALGERLGVLGPSLAGVLAASAATGAPLSPALRDVAAIARDRRRRDAENDARRLPVTLLFPLVCCVLPAFVLLAVVPLLAASLAALDI